VNSFVVGICISDCQPIVDPQSHLANMRTKPDYEYEISGKRLDGRLYWHSVPVIVVVDDIDKHAGAVEQYKRLDDRTNYEKPVTRPRTVFEMDPETSTSSTSTTLLVFLYVLLAIVTLVFLSLIYLIIRRTRRVRKATKRKENDGIRRIGDMIDTFPPPSALAQNNNKNDDDFGTLHVIDFNSAVVHTSSSAAELF
jgi:hypothetical protein